MHTYLSAIEIATRPEAYCDQPARFALAWETLKKARGQTIDWRSLPCPAHIVHQDGATNTFCFDLMRARIGARVRAIAAAKGYSLPAKGGAE